MIKPFNFTDEECKSLGLTSERVSLETDYGEEMYLLSDPRFFGPDYDEEFVEEIYD